VYVEAHEEPETINWQESRNSFTTHHVPLGVMKLKKKEFEDLKQGSMTMSEYVTRFTQLAIMLLITWIQMRRGKIGFSMDWMMILHMHWKLIILTIFKTSLKGFSPWKRRAIMERHRKMQRAGAQGSHKKFRDGPSSQGPIFHSSQQQRMQVAAQGF
jgi:hypothetical protein